MKYNPIWKKQKSKKKEVKINQTESLEKAYFFFAICSCLFRAAILITQYYLINPGYKHIFHRKEYIACYRLCITVPFIYDAGGVI